MYPLCITFNVMSCIHSNTQHAHTCYLDNNTEYCVYCIIEKTKDAPIEQFDPIFIVPTFNHQIKPWFGHSLQEIMEFDATELSNDELDMLDPCCIKRHHKKKIIEADLSYPVLLFELEPLSYAILDGYHRMSHGYWFKKMDKMKYRIVDANILEQCIWMNHDEQ